LARARTRERFSLIMVAAGGILAGILTGYVLVWLLIFN
jgi:NhaP-type Na+/H+ or K+/H+ antiporter